MNYLERNYAIVKLRMVEQMENSLKFGRTLIDSELDTGLLNFIVKPIVKTFYDHWSERDAKANTLKQIKITLDAGIKLVKDGASEELFEKIIFDNFPKFEKADQTYNQTNHAHKNYGKLRQAAKETFINYLTEVAKLLAVKEDVNDYGELCRVAFKSKEQAEKNLRNQLNITEKSIKIVESDISILRINFVGKFGKKIIVRALRKGFENTKKEFFEGLNETYDQY
ncbi:MAG: hypothetical protein Lokiarch_18140 [Candidatus Lokiarchaeum sp. GC14_75]|nr:MAG: hypothetical protein Lokiarch_18140 [Candidatus Lokiarchaeum sp. GC14_75]